MIPTLYKLAGGSRVLYCTLPRALSPRAFYFWRPFRVMAVRRTGETRDVMRRQRSGSAGFCADLLQGYAEKPRSVYSFLMASVHRRNQQIIPLQRMKPFEPDCAGGSALPRPRAESGTSGDSWNFSVRIPTSSLAEATNPMMQRRL